MDTLKLPFNGLVRQKLEFAQSVWNPYLKKDIETLEKIQRRATRIIPSLRDLPFSHRLILLDMTTLAYRRLRGDMIETFKYINCYYDVNPKLTLPNLQNTNVENRRGHSQKLKKLHCKTTMRQNIFSQRVTNNWNSLPDYVVKSTHVNQFKNRLDAHWNNHPLKFDYESAGVYAVYKPN